MRSPDSKSSSSTSLACPDRFRFDAEIGSGAICAVYRVYDNYLGREIALKVPHPNLLDHANVRPKREVLVAQRISHKNVVRVYDMYPEGIGMELVKGGTLADFIRNSSPLPVARIVEIALDISEGLTAAHSEGVVHADLKPSNILLETDGTAKITDFGLSYSLTTISSACAKSGTRKYMSPEQRLGALPDQRSDIFALGLVICEMFIGHLPAEEGETLAANLSPLAKVPRLIKRLLRAALRDSPTLRPSASEIVSLLQKWKRRQLSKAWSKKNALPISLTLLLVIGGWLAFRRLVRTDTAAPIVLLPVRTDGQYESALFADAFTDSVKTFAAEGVILWYPDLSTSNFRLSGGGQPYTTIEASVACHSGRVAFNIKRTSRTGQRTFTGVLDRERSATEALILARRILPEINLSTSASRLPPIYFECLTTLRHSPKSIDRLLVDESELSRSSALSTSPKAIAMMIELRLALYAATSDSKWRARAGDLLSKQVAVPEYPALAIAAAKFYVADKNDREASNIAESALRLHPNSLELLRFCGRLDIKRGALEEGISHLQSATKINPLDWTTYTSLGGAYISVPDSEKAIRAFESAAKLEPKTSTWSNLGGAYIVGGRFSDALPFLERAVTQTASGPASCNLGTTLWFLNRHSLALVVLEHAANLDHSELVLGCLAHAYRWSGTKDAADRTFREAINLSLNELKAHPNDPSVLGRLATYEGGLGEKQALVDISTARRLKISDFDLLTKHAIVDSMLGDKQGASELVSEVVRRGGQMLVESHPDLARFCPRILAIAPTKRRLSILNFLFYWANFWGS